MERKASGSCLVLVSIQHRYKALCIPVLIPLDSSLSFKCSQAQIRPVKKSTEASWFQHTMLSCPMGQSQQTLQHGAPTQLILCEREGLYHQCQKYKSSISAASWGYAAEIVVISYCKITVNAMHVFFRPPQHGFAPSHHDMSPMQSLVQDHLFCCFSETNTNRNELY